MRRLVGAVGVGGLVAAVAAASVLAATLAVVSVKLTAVKTAYGAPVTCTLQEGTLGTVPDAYVDEFAAATNFGASVDLIVQTRNNRNKRVFLRFDLSPCGISGSAIVHSAMLTLRMSSAPNATRTYNLRRATASWTEAGVTWNTQPTVGALTDSTATGTTAGVDRSWNVATDVQSFVSGFATNEGWRISDSVESDGNGNTLQATFRSSEFGTVAVRPKLIVVYSPPI